MNDESLLNERISVAAIFYTDNNQLCRPLRFVRENGREVEITKIGLDYPTRRGLKTVHIFDVTDGGADYRLEFDSERLTWHLVREADHFYAA